MKKPKICVTLVSNEPEAARKVEPLVDLFEVRIDLIGDGWQELAKQLKKPWIACNRNALEGGRCTAAEENRIETLFKAMELGADIVDIELSTKGLAQVVPLIKQKAKCLISHHDMERTPPLDEMKNMAESQLKAGADICKVATTANSFEDNLAVLRLIKEFRGTRLVSFCMGELGRVSRLMCPLVGGYFTYASLKRGKESAPGQMPVEELAGLYEILQESLTNIYNGHPEG